MPFTDTACETAVFSSMQDAPQYQAPALPAAYSQLLAQSQQNANDAAIAGARQEGNRLTASYGPLTSADSAGLLARYGANLAMAGNGGASRNPFAMAA